MFGPLETIERIERQINRWLPSSAPIDPAWRPRLPSLHAKQAEIIDSPAKRKVIRAGRRSGKTVAASIIGIKSFLSGRRVLYAAPTQEQVDAFWWNVTNALYEPMQSGVLYKNETRHIIEKPHTHQRIRAKTAWNADTLRGDYADLLILDEWQLMDEQAWELVGAPMLLDNDGDAIFVYTPPSLRSRSVSKARDPLHAAKLFKRAEQDKSGRWATFHFTSHDNPHISAQALAEITRDMTALAIRQEIEAEDVEEAPGALWKRNQIEAGRRSHAPDLVRIVVSVDPSATSSGDEAGIIGSGIGWCECQGKPELHGFVLADESLQGSPSAWAQVAVNLYHRLEADALVAESNNGGEMVALTISTIPGAPYVDLVHASRGKATRAEPISAQYEHGRVHHVGHFPRLEDEMCQWEPGQASPNRMDALVWGLTDLMLTLPLEGQLVY